MRKLILLLMLASLAVPAAAVSTSHWTQSNAADFTDGKLHDVVVTNLGDVKLSREVKTLLDEDPKIGMVTALAQTPNGTIYAGTAPQGVLLQIAGGKVTTAATIDDAVSITALLAEPNGALLVGATGGKGRVLRIAAPGAKPQEIFSAKDVQYVWGLARSDDGTVYAATGPNGQLFAIHPDGKQEEIYKSDENNLTAMVSDGKGNLYLGTDPDGLVIRLNLQTGNSFVVYNTDEEEITALALDDKGNLYAATGQAAAPAPQQPEPAKDETAGRPQPTTGSPLPSQPPNPAKPPAPNPNPGEPSPIPQQPKVVWPHQRRSDVVSIAFLTGNDDPAPPDVPGVPGQPAEPAPPDAGAAPDDNGAAKGGEANPKTAAEQQADQAKAAGNAIYKIDPDGFVTEVFRDQVVIYSMIASKDVLIVGTGDDGNIYQVDPAAQETVVIAKTDAKQVTSLLAAADGQVYVGLSNTGGIATMSDGYAGTGTYTSAVLDGTQVSRFGVIQMHGSLPKGTKLTVATRCGNIKDAQAQGWSAWTAEKDAQEFLHIDSPPARFLQYRITFATTDPARTPIINDIDVAYQLPHLAPVIKSIKIIDAQQAAAAGGGQGAPPPPGGKPGDTPKPQGTGAQTITWDASSPDDDSLVYTLYFRTAPAGPWIMLKDKLTDPTFTWDTKSVADGRYQVDVIASDAAANPAGDGKTASRVSDVLVVVNTAPVIGDLKSAVTGRSVKIDLRVTERVGTIASMDYSVDSNDVWQAVLPVDKIFDEPEESVSFSVNDLPPGEHQITLRATDDRGNVGLQTVTVTVAEK
jgi:hypothetical protein